MKKFLALFLAAILAAFGPQAALPSGLTLMGVSKSGVALSAFALTFDHSAVDTTNATVYTFATQAVGVDVTGGNKRYTVVAIGSGGNAASVSSSTICGVAGTEASADISSVGSSAIHYADTTGLGTSCTIAVTMSGAQTRAGIGVYRLINPNAGASGATTGATCASSVSDVVTVSITVPAGGGAVGVVDSNAIASRTYTWAGLTEDFDATIESPQSFGGAHGTTAGSPLVITATASASTTAMTGCSASWAP